MAIRGNLSFFRHQIGFYVVEIWTTSDKENSSSPEDAAQEGTPEPSSAPSESSEPVQAACIAKKSCTENGGFSCIAKKNTSKTLKSYHAHVRRSHDVFCLPTHVFGGQTQGRLRHEHMSDGVYSPYARRRLQTHTRMERERILRQKIPRRLPV